MQLRIGIGWIALIGFACCSNVLADAVDVIDQCTTHITEQAVGMDELEQHCPGLSAALDELGYSPLLTADWQHTLNRDALIDLYVLSTRYRANRQSDPPDTQSLTAILDELAQQQAPQPKSWWTVFKQWLRSLFDHAPQNISYEWLDKLLQTLSDNQYIIKLIGYLLLALLIAMAGAIVVNELRILGMFKSRTRPARGQTLSTQAVLDIQTTPTVDTLETIPLLERPAVLLRLLVVQLSKTGRLNAERTRTHQELTLFSQFDGLEARERFKAVALLAERLFYGGQVNATAMQTHIQQVLAEGRVLLQQLHAAQGRSK